MVLFDLHLLKLQLDDDWWDTNALCDPPLSSNERLLYTLQFENLLKFGFGTFLFMLVEMHFRVFLRALDPEACNGGTGSFRSIYETLLSPNQLDLPEDDRRHAFELLNLFRLLRNTMHNDGVYIASNGQDTVARYRGVDYPFVHGQPVNFVFWNLLLHIANDIRQLLYLVVSHPRILKVDEIADPTMPQLIPGAYYPHGSLQREEGIRFRTAGEQQAA